MEASALVKGKLVVFHACDFSGSIGADVVMTDPAAPSCIERAWDEAILTASVPSMCCMAARTHTDRRMKRNREHPTAPATNALPERIGTFQRLGHTTVQAEAASLTESV